MSQIHHHEGWGPLPCSSTQTTHTMAWEPPDRTLSFLQGVKQACREASRTRHDHSLWRFNVNSPIPFGLCFTHVSIPDK